jgi:hypothetical protein
MLWRVSTRGAASLCFLSDGDILETNTPPRNVPTRPRQCPSNRSLFITGQAALAAAHRPRAESIGCVSPRCVPPPEPSASVCLPDSISWSWLEPFSAAAVHLAPAPENSPISSSWRRAACYPWRPRAGNPSPGRLYADDRTWL